MVLKIDRSRLDKWMDGCDWPNQSIHSKDSGFYRTNSQMDNYLSLTSSRTIGLSSNHFWNSIGRYAAILISNVVIFRALVMGSITSQRRDEIWLQGERERERENIKCLFLSLGEGMSRWTLIQEIWVYWRNHKQTKLRRTLQALFNLSRGRLFCRNKEIHVELIWCIW